MHGGLILEPAQERHMMGREGAMGIFVFGPDSAEEVTTD